jgi:hypothetical protein
MMQPTTASDRKWLNSLYTGEIKEMIARKKKRIERLKSDGNYTDRELLVFRDELQMLKEELNIRQSE